MKYCWILLLWAPAVLKAQSGSEHFSITGDVKGLPAQSQVALVDANDPTDTVSKAVVSNGHFEMTGQVDEANLYQLYLGGVARTLTLFMDNDAIQVKGDTAHFDDIAITGSVVNNDFKDFQDTFNPLFRTLNQLNQQARSTPGFQDNDSLMAIYTGQLDKISEAIDGFVAQKKNSPVSPFLLVVTGQVERDPALLEQRFAQLQPAATESFFGRMLKDEIARNKVGAIGSEATAFTQTDTSGKAVSLADFRGKYVLIDFWASWCRPCRMENPNVVAAYHKFSNKNFTVLGISLDRSRDAWIQAIHDDGLAWTQVSDLKYWQNEVAQKYNVQGIPQNFLIDPNGKIVAKNLRGAALESKLCELLGCE